MDTDPDSVPVYTSIYEAHWVMHGHAVGDFFRRWQALAHSEHPDLQPVKIREGYSTKWKPLNLDALGDPEAYDMAYGATLRTADGEVRISDFGSIDDVVTVWIDQWLKDTPDLTAMAVRDMLIPLCPTPGMILAYEQRTRVYINARGMIIPGERGDYAAPTVLFGQFMGLPAVPPLRTWYGPEYSDVVAAHDPATIEQVHEGTLVTISTDLPTREDILRTYGTDMEQYRLHEEYETPGDMFATGHVAPLIPDGLPRYVEREPEPMNWDEVSFE